MQVPLFDVVNIKSSCCSNLEATLILDVALNKLLQFDIIHMWWNIVIWDAINFKILDIISPNLRFKLIKIFYLEL